MEEDGRGSVGDGEGFFDGEGGEGGACESEGAEVVGMAGCEVVAGEDDMFHKEAPLLAAADLVLIVEL
ncbi:hypothetical protein MRB53_009119 [Persea americana]|uniref:Uncharacterized protein n=1 Tax=Persea americana TaxID=3435 RepID=A0ACC2LN89_PERAE|nr:hypothetical protein MRB53_009119 [Persea americana]